MGRAPEGARFALTGALGKVGGEAALEALLALLQDPFAQGDAAEAAAAVALRTGQAPRALAALRESGLGSIWRWGPRAALGDAAWVGALVLAWPGLAQASRLQALQAAVRLPEDLRRQVKAATADASGQVQAAWQQL